MEQDNRDIAMIQDLTPGMEHLTLRMERDAEGSVVIRQATGNIVVPPHMLVQFHAVFQAQAFPEGPGPTLPPPEEPKPLEVELSDASGTLSLSKDEENEVCVQDETGDCIFFPARDAGRVTEAIRKVAS